MKANIFRKIIKDAITNWSSDTKEITEDGDRLIAKMEDGSELAITVKQLQSSTIKRDNYYK
jgi:hypothetical protein